jgi:hypothetical protein
MVGHSESCQPDTDRQVGYRRNFVGGTAELEPNGRARRLTTMPRRIALFCALFGVALSAQTGIPSTSAGQALRAWLGAYNSGDRARVEAFVQKFEPSVSADTLMAFRKVNGRIEFVGIDTADNQHITFQARQSGSGSRVTGELTVTGETAVQIQRFNFVGLRP